MQAFLEFIQAYWQYISFGILIFIEVLLLILKRTKIVDPSIYARLVSLVKLAEEAYGPGQGKAKLDAVVGVFLEDCGDKYPRSQVEKIVEEILETPQKKGVTRNESKS